MLRLLDLEETEGDLEEDERKMIRGVFGLEDTTVREIMTPRTDIVALDTESTFQEAVSAISVRMSRLRCQPAQSCVRSCTAVPMRGALAAVPSRSAYSARCGCI